MTPFKMERMGMIMEPKPGEAAEVEGVLNPAAVRGPDGQLYLFPRLVGKGNYSRIGIARVLFDASGDPVGVERMGYALEPEADYEVSPDGRGGCEDPRVTYIEGLGHYVMTYTALTSHGPRIAVARSGDLIHWERLGLAKFDPYKDIAFTGVDDKDASVFPHLILDPAGKASAAMLHRPLFRGTRPEEEVERPQHYPADLDMESIWISYWHVDAHTLEPRGRQFVAHRRLARPEADWEKLKIGAGAPPMLCRHGWLMIYHGVQEKAGSTPQRRNLAYSAGVMVLQKDHPHRILYRSPHPVLEPENPMELQGTVDGVVFPTGMDRRDDLGQPNRFDVYYGMADDRIGVARMIVPEALPDLGVL
jgi:predicted GH43/DUF377 family glycosyl hydrolase